VDEFVLRAYSDPVRQWVQRNSWFYWCS